MKLSDLPTLAFNTGRAYSTEGQRIAAAQLPDGRVAFYDVDRVIDGVTYHQCSLTERDLMKAYGHNEYAQGFLGIFGADHEADLEFTLDLRKLARSVPGGIK